MTVQRILSCLAMGVVSATLSAGSVFEGSRLWATAEDGTKLLGLGGIDMWGTRYGKAWPVAATRDGNVTTLAFQDKENTNLTVRATVAETNGVYTCSYYLEVPTNEVINKVRLNLQPPRGAGKWNVEKHGIWKRCAASPMGEAYEVPNVKLKRVLGKKGAIYFELIGDENWSGPYTEYMWCRKVTDGKYEARFRMYASSVEGRGFEAAAKHAGRPFGVRVFTEKRNNLWESGPVQLKCWVSNVTLEEKTDVPLSIIVRNYDNKVVVDRKESLTLKAGERKEFTIEIPGMARDLFFAEASVTPAEGEEIFARTNVAILPPFEFKHQASSIFGICMGGAERFFRYEIDKEYALLKRMGMRLLRARGGNRTLREKYGLETLYHEQCPSYPFNPSNATHVADVKRRVAGIVAQGASLYEFGNEIGFGAKPEVQHRLYDAYLSWLKAIIAERDAQKADFKIVYGCSSHRPHVFKLIQEKGIFDLLDGFTVHPGRGYFTSDLGGGGWRYLGMVQLSKKLIRDAGYGDKPVYLTEVYAKTKPNDGWGDSYRQAGENAVLNAALALAEKVDGFNIYQLHEGISYDLNGVNPGNMEYHYGILHRDNSPKPSFMGYVTAAEELDGASFVRYITPEKKGSRLSGVLFDSPRGRLALLWDRAEGFEQMKHAPFPRKKDVPYFHYEPWFNHWRVVREHTFKASGPTVTLVDVIGRRAEVPVTDGQVTLKLTGAPVFVYGLDL